MFLVFVCRDAQVIASSSVSQACVLSVCNAQWCMFVLQLILKNTFGFHGLWLKMTSTNEHFDD